MIAEETIIIIIIIIIVTKHTDLSHINVFHHANALVFQRKSIKN